MFSWNLIGHKQITNFLELAIQNERLAHAYLFYGPKQIGKMTLTRQFIQNLLCYEENKKKKEKFPCDACEHCRQVKKGIHPDVVFIRREEGKKNITIEQIRELQEILSVHSFFKSYKIAVIEEADFLHPSAANALLKTLEEPTKRTILILVARQINHLPVTVLSRAQRVKFLPVPKKEIAEQLLARGVAHGQANELASLAAGKPGRAIVFLEHEQNWQQYLEQLKNFFLILKNPLAERFRFAEKFLSEKETLVEKGELLVPVLNFWQLLVRDILLYKLEQSDKIINLQGLPALAQAAPLFEIKKLVAIELGIEKAKKYLSLNANPRLVLENVLLDF